MEQIYAYFPETEFFSDKTQDQCRICHFDCAVVNAKHPFEVLAERGFHNAVGKNLFSIIGWQEKEMEDLNCFLSSDFKILLRPCIGGSLLLFRQWYSSLGLLLAIRLPYEETELRKELNYASHHATSPIFSPDSTPDNHSKPTPKEALAEVRYYTERIFVPSKPISLFGHALLLANFTGCALQPSALPYSFPELDTQEGMRLSAFLLCTLLSLRKTDGNNLAFSKNTEQDTREYVGNVQCEAPPRFSLSVKQTADSYASKTSPVPEFPQQNQAIPVFASTDTPKEVSGAFAEDSKQFAFLNFPVFQDITLQKSGEAVCLTAYFAEKKDFLRASSYYDLTYCFIFSPIVPLLQ